MGQELSNLFRIQDHVNKPPDIEEKPLSVAYEVDVSQMMVYHCQKLELNMPALMKLGLHEHITNSTHDHCTCLSLH